MKLKKRINNDYITVSTEVLQVVQDKTVSRLDGSIALYNYFDNLISNELTTHDKVWLMLIANWTEPNVGMNMIEITKWFDLAKRIDEIDESADNIEFSISPKEAKMIFSKLKNKEFKISRITSSLQYFLHDLQEVTGMSLLPEDKEE